MDAESRAGVCERAIRGVRRLAGLAAEIEEGDVVRQALVRELRALLDLESATIVTCDEAALRDAELTFAPENEQGNRGRRRVLELLSAAQTHEGVILLAREPQGLGADELAAAAALVDMASVVLGLLGARHEAASDELTGCLSRRAALARLSEELARAQRSRSRVSCLMLDIDNLKQINDTFGHLEGDRVLREAGASMRGELRAYDVAARYGGDEFLAVLPATEEREAVQTGTRMAAAVARIRSPAHAIAPVSVTYGAATSRADDLPATLLQRADNALVIAKRRTRASGETEADASS